MNLGRNVSPHKLSPQVFHSGDNSRLLCGKPAENPRRARIACGKPVDNFSNAHFALERLANAQHHGIPLCHSAMFQSLLVTDVSQTIAHPASKTSQTIAHPANKTLRTTTSSTATAVTATQQAPCTPVRASRGA
jgi:hypothetical protein